jgi:hypothetical protein
MELSEEPVEIMSLDRKSQHRMGLVCVENSFTVSLSEMSMSQVTPSRLVAMIWVVWLSWDNKQIGASIVTTSGYPSPTTSTNSPKLAIPLHKYKFIVLVTTIRVSSTHLTSRIGALTIQLHSTSRAALLESTTTKLPLAEPKTMS